MGRTRPRGGELKTDLRKNPCLYCPYRRDVPSGVWDRSEYEKLAEYDAPTMQQPLAAFHCHEKPELLCAGWVQVHGIEGPSGLLALRLLGGPEIHVSKIPLFGTGYEAMKHGLRSINHPTAQARKAVLYLLQRIRSRKRK